MFIELKTKRLILRPLSSKDLETTHKYASDLDVTKYMFYLPNHSVEETMEFLQYAEAEWGKEHVVNYEFAICLGAIHIGGISLSQVSCDCYELGWILDRDYQWNGYCTEAALELVRFAKSLGAKELIAHCDTRNNASRRVMEKIGMNFVLEQDRQYLDGRGAARQYMYSMKL